MAPVHSLPLHDYRRRVSADARSIAGGYNAWLNEGCEIVADSKLTVHQLNRYSRTMLLEEIGEEGQLKLLNAKVLLVGAGGSWFPCGLVFGSIGGGDNRHR